MDLIEAVSHMEGMRDDLATCALAILRTELAEPWNLTIGVSHPEGAYLILTTDDDPGFSRFIFPEFTGWAIDDAGPAALELLIGDLQEEARARA